MSGLFFSFWKSKLKIDVDQTLRSEASISRVNSDRKSDYVKHASRQKQAFKSRIASRHLPLINITKCSIKSNRKVPVTLELGYFFLNLGLG